MSRNLNSTLAANLGNSIISPFFLVQITFSSGTAYIWSGIGNLVWGGNTYVGVGGLGNIANISEGSDVKADGTSVSLSGIVAGLVNGSTVIVPGSAMPWATFAGQNASYSYGIDDGSPPVISPLPLTVGEVLTISATGSVSDSGGGAVFPGTAGFGPDGFPPPSADSPGLTGKYLSTKYMSGSTLGTGGLCGTFADAYGNVVQPLSISTGGSFTVPTGAVQLQFGIDDDIFADNSGYFMVTVTPPGSGVGSNTLLQETLTDIKLGAPAFIYFGLMSGGSIIGEPYRVFYGTVDKPSIKVGATTMSISLALENRLVDLQRANQRRYTAADQKLTYPTDMGFNWVEILNDIALRWG